MLNRVTIAGRLSRDIELRRTQSGTAVTSFTLAVDDDFKDKQTGERPTSWVDCVAWGAMAEFLSRYFSKGRMVILDGRLKTRDWTDKNGNKHKATEVVAEHVYFGDNNRDKKERPVDWDAPGTHKGWDAVDECFSRDMYGIEPGDYSAPADGYPAQSDPGSEFAELTTDDWNLPF